jgi:hypothetical protein
MARRALIVGDNYPGTSAQLSGCVNDAQHMAAYFRDQGFDDLTILLDTQATKAAIERELGRLVGSLTGRDLGVFYNSGHGTQGSVSLSPGASAVKHEGIVPSDYRTAGIIWDQHVRDELAYVHGDARMVVIMDTCFSGGMYRLAPPLTDHYRRVRYLPPEEWLRDADIEAEWERLAGGLEGPLDENYERQFVLNDIARVASQRVDKAFPVLLLAASQPNQVSWCAEIGGVPQGAFTYALLQVLTGHGPDGDQRTPSTYRQLMYGGKDLAGVTTVRAVHPGWLPAADLADQDPALYGTTGRVRWPLFEA